MKLPNFISFLLVWSMLRSSVLVESFTEDCGQGHRLTALTCTCDEGWSATDNVSHSFSYYPKEGIYRLNTRASELNLPCVYKCDWNHTHPNPRCGSILHPRTEDCGFGHRLTALTCTCDEGWTAADDVSRAFFYYPKEEIYRLNTRASELNLPCIYKCDWNKTNPNPMCGTVLNLSE